MRPVAYLGLALSLVLPTLAHAAPPLDDPEGAIVEELVVVARDRGPAWWRVSDDDTTVYILALPDTGLPKDLKWDTSGLERRLRGSNALIGGGRSFRLNSLRNIGLLLSLRRSLRMKGTMEAELPVDLRTRFVAAREAAGKDAKHYAGWGPMVAGFILVADSREGGRGRKAEDDVQRMARKLKIRESRRETRDAAPVIKEFKSGLTPEIQTACLASALDDVEAGPGVAAEAAQGWARGDIGAALKAPRGFEKCFQVVAGGPAVWRQNVDDQAKDIAEALTKPGKAVAMVRLRQLIARTGVIETLEEMGFEVEGPAVKPDPARP